MTLGLQVTEYHKACTFKDAYGFMHAYLLLTQYMFLLLNLILSEHSLISQFE